MILKVDLNDGERTITATEIKVGDMDPDLFKRPTKGKEVTEAEYQEIVREKMKEMGRDRPGGGRGPGFHVIRQ
jgi:hypothetical protein